MKHPAQPVRLTLCPLPSLLCRRPQAPDTVLLPSRLYTFCVWARAAPSMPAATSIVSYIKVHDPQNGFAYVTGTPSDVGPNSLRITRAWQQLCLREISVSRQLTGSITMELTALGEFHFDDASMQSTSLDAAWQSGINTNARIETIRKGNFNVRFLDAATGQALRPGTVKEFNATLRRHDFLFGTTFEPSAVPAASRAW